MPNITTPAIDPPLKMHLPAMVRLVLYIVTAVISIVVAYVQAKGWSWFGEPEVALFSSLVALVNVLAASNIDKPSKAGDG